MAEKHRRRSEVSFTKMGLSSSSCRPPRVIRVFHWQPIGPSPFPFTQAQSVLRLFSQGKRTHTIFLSLTSLPQPVPIFIQPLHVPWILILYSFSSNIAKLLFLLHFLLLLQGSQSGGGLEVKVRFFFSPV